MANSYLAGVFNVDTPGTTITALETLKGSAIAETDFIYFYGGAEDVMLILDKSFIHKQIFRGRTSAGAASAGKRGGIMVINRGITIESLGDATNTNSGFNSNPITPDASSLGEAIRHDGDYSTVWTRKGDAYLSTSRFCLEVRYGWLNVKKLVVRNTHLAVVANLGTNATRTNSGHIFDQCDVTLAAGYALQIHTVSIAVKITASRTIVRQQGTGGTTLGILLGSATSVLEAGGEIDVSNSYLDGSVANNAFTPLTIGAIPFYLGCMKVSFADNRQPYSIPFYIDKTVVPVTAGTLITVTLSQDLATLMTGLTLKGIACTDRTVTGANTLTFVAPTLTAGIGDVVGSFTGYDNFTITNGITAQAGTSAPGAFTLSASARQGEILLTWIPATKFDYYRIYQDNVLIKDNLTDAVTWLATGLTGGQLYDFYVIAKNDTGESQSNTVSIKPIADGVLPENTVIKELLETLRTQVLAIKDSDGNLVFSSDNTIIGWITDLPTRSETAAFPCCEIYPTGNGSQGSEYLSQREISVDYTFEIVAHQYYGTPSRDTGVDLYDINKIGEAIRQQVYRLNDLSQAGTDPCTGFIQVNPSFGLMPNYELCCKNVNSVVISFSIRADNADIGI